MSTRSHVPTKNPDAQDDRPWESPVVFNENGHQWGDGLL